MRPAWSPRPAARRRWAPNGGTSHRCHVLSYRFVLYSRMAGRTGVFQALVVCPDTVGYASPTAIIRTGVAGPDDHSRAVAQRRLHRWLAPPWQVHKIRFV